MSIFDALAKWNRTREKTNAEGILGKEAIVTAAIDNLKGTGQISLEGMDWTARTRDGQTVSKGSVVRILAIEGVKVIVEKVEKEEE
jgi:membrane protein implicated in regulation of membrane protease activity